MVMWDENPPYMPLPIVTYSIIIINFIVFFLTYLILPQAGIPPDEVIHEFGLIPADVLSGYRLYTIITSMFLHAGLSHILGNMFYLYVFGDNVEAALGRKRFIILYFASGLGASLFHLMSNTIISPFQAFEALKRQGITPWEIPAVGASGAISGVLGAYLLLFPRAQLKGVTIIGVFPVLVELPASAYIIIWFLFQLIYAIASLGAGLSAGIAFWAHIGGFVTGLALTPYLVDRERLRKLYLRVPSI